MATSLGTPSYFDTMLHSFDNDFATECQNSAILTLSCKIVEETSLLLTRWSWREGLGGRGKHASLANYNLAGICSATTTVSVVNTNTNTGANTNTSVDNYNLTGTCSDTTMSVLLPYFVKTLSFNVSEPLVHTFKKPLNLAGTGNFL